MNRPGSIALVLATWFLLLSIQLVADKLRTIQAVHFLEKEPGFLLTRIGILNRSLLFCFAAIAAPQLFGEGLYSTSYTINPERRICSFRMYCIAPPLGGFHEN